MRALLLLGLGALLSAPARAQATAPAVTTTIIGCAVDRDGAPVSDAAVGVFSYGSPFDVGALLETPLTRTDEAGRYRLELEGHERRRLIVARIGFQVCSQDIDPDRAGTEQAPALLLPGVSLHGRVRDDDGKPIAGASIQAGDPLAPLSMRGRNFQSGARTNYKGFFTVVGVPRTGLLITASAPGYATRELLAGHQSPLDLTLARTGYCRGRVLDASGEPVAGVAIRIMAPGRQPRAPAAVHSAADGSFRITAPAQPRYRITAWSAEGQEFSSGSLRGAVADVELRPVRATGAPVRQVEVRCLDAETKQPIRAFHASVQSPPAEQLQLAYLGHLDRRQPYRDAAQLLAVPSGWGGHGTVIVDAPGHGFAAGAVPAEDSGPLVLELGPESFLTGTVTDDATGQPAAGVFVRALPMGDSMGGGPDPRTTGVITDANGRYRIGGLCPGDYGVQVYGPDRPASKMRQTKVAAGNTAQLDLALPRERRMQIELRGPLPTAPLASLSFTTGYRSGTGPGFGNRMPAVGDVTLGTRRQLELGPFDRGTIRAELKLASRVRLGAGTVLPLGELDSDRTNEIELPDLRSVLWRGNIDLPGNVPTERLAVLLHAAGTRDHRPHAAGVDADGSFEFDLPPGAYAVQLVDLASGIAFHTEPETVAIDANSRSIELTPAMHWLTIDLASKGDAAPVATALSVTLPRPSGDLGAFLQQGSVRRDTECRQVPCTAGTSHWRWLVPPGEITIGAMQSFAILEAGTRTWSNEECDSTTVTVPQPDQRITLTVPPAPTDAELQAGRR